MERSFGLAFTTLASFAPLAQAAHPQQAVKAEGTARPFEFVATDATRHTRGYSFARQVLPARSTDADSAERQSAERQSAAVARAQQASATGTSARAQSRIIYLNRDGAILRPGDNDSIRQVSSIIAEPIEHDGWDVDDDYWNATVSCIQDLYAPFDVKVTDEDPGDAPHVEVMFGGSPGDVGLPDNVAGVSPFTTDCAIIENSVVFAFTDILPDDDPRMVCEVTAQEIAHSFGLDHEMLASDPMTYLDYVGDRKFQDRTASCGEYADRTCGVNGVMCRQRQNSVALLKERLGVHGASALSGGSDSTTEDPAGSGGAGGCTAAGGPQGAMALALLVVLRRRRRT